MFVKVNSESKVNLPSKIFTRLQLTLYTNWRYAFKGSMYKFLNTSRYAKIKCWKEKLQFKEKVKGLQQREFKACKKHYI